MMTCEEVIKALREGKAVCKKDLNYYICLENGKTVVRYKDDDKYCYEWKGFQFSNDEIINGTDYEIYEKSILSVAEKKYLSRILNPLKNSVRKITISKWQLNDTDREYIQIYFWDDRDIFDCWVFPEFEKGTMYAGMEPSRKYTLEELGL